MSNKQIVAHKPRFSAAIANGVYRSVASASRRELPNTIPKDGTTPGFVESDPVFDLSAQGLEDDTRIVGVVGYELTRVEESAVSFIELFWEIPGG